MSRSTIAAPMRPVPHKPISMPFLRSLRVCRYRQRYRQSAGGSRRRAAVAMRWRNRYHRAPKQGQPERMEIELTSFAAGAAAASGTVVVIDVFRAFTAAAVALAQGAGRIIMVASLDEALALR